MKSVDVGKELDGTTPPSVFIGSWNYPKVYAGPMIAPIQGDISIMDSPESWIPNQTTQEEIIGYRLNLVRGKQTVGIQDFNNSFVEKLQEISLHPLQLKARLNLEAAQRVFHSAMKQRPTAQVL